MLEKIPWSLYDCPFSGIYVMAMSVNLTAIFIVFYFLVIFLCLVVLSSI